MIWEVFRQQKAGGYHTHCGNVHAPDREMALLFAEIQHGRRKPTNSLWVVPNSEIGEVDTDDTTFGGTTDKSYRFARSYDVEPAAEEVAASEEELTEAERKREQTRQSRGDD